MKAVCGKSIFSSICSKSNILLFVCLLLFSCSLEKPESKTTIKRVPVAAEKPASDAMGERVNVPPKVQKVDIKNLYVEGQVLVVDINNPNADDSNTGSIDKPFKTINAAAQKAQPGMTVLVREGLYRERVIPARSGKKDLPVVFMGVDRERVIVRGSEILKGEWTVSSSNPQVFELVYDPNIFSGNLNPFLRSISVGPNDSNIAARPTNDKIMPYSLGQIFVNGKPMTQLQQIKEISQKEGSWIISADGKKLLLNLPEGIANPAESEIEISVRNRIFAPKIRGMQHIHVKGFTFEHCANQGAFPQGGAVSVRSGKNWLIEDNIVRYAKMIGIDCGSETWDAKNLLDTAEKDKRLMIGGGHTIQNNLIVDNGLCGIAGWNHKGTKILGNVLKRNNCLKIDGKIAKWEEWGAIKLHASDALIKGNLICDNEAFGIWIDHGHENAVVMNNVIHNNQRAGIFFEYGAGKATVLNNVISSTRPYGDFYKGFGVYTHDAADITVANNLFINNAGSAVLMRTITNRQFHGKPVYTSNQRILNNIMIDNGGFVMFPMDYPRATNNKSDFNTFVASDLTSGFGWPWSIGLEGKHTLAKIQKICEDKKNPQLGKDFSLMKEKKGVSPLLWGAVTGSDLNSLFSNKGIKVNLDPESMNLTLIVEDEDILRKLDQIEKHLLDFNESPISGKVIAGPFQNLKVGKNEFKLWNKK